MSENEMSQQQRDAAVIAEYRNIVAEHHAAVDAHDRYVTSEAIDAYAPDAMESALRTIDRLRAENDTLRAEHAADCIRFAEILEREGFRMDGRVFRAKAAALASAERDGAGTAAGDATAGDGDGQS